MTQAKDADIATTKVSFYLKEKIGLIHCITRAYGYIQD